MWQNTGGNKVPLGVHFPTLSLKKLTYKMDFLPRDFLSKNIIQLVTF